MDTMIMGLTSLSQFHGLLKGYQLPHKPVQPVGRSPGAGPWARSGQGPRPGGVVEQERGESVRRAKGESEKGRRQAAALARELLESESACRSMLTDEPAAIPPAGTDPGRRGAT